MGTMVSRKLRELTEEDIDKIADAVIQYERYFVSGISTALGAPGGAAMVATMAGCGSSNSSTKDSGSDKAAAEATTEAAASANCVRR